VLLRAMFESEPDMMRHTPARDDHHLDLATVPVGLT